MYMHIGGMGDGAELAAKVKAVFDKVRESRGGDPASGPATEVENSLDTAMIARVLGRSGKMSRGVYKVTIGRPDVDLREHDRSEEHTSELQSLMRISYAVFCLKKKNTKQKTYAQSITTHN